VAQPDRAAQAGGLGGHGLGGDGLRGLGEQVVQRDLEGLADGGEQLAGRLLAAPLDLGQIAEAHPRAP
jgi:hypothetical protein